MRSLLCLILFPLCQAATIATVAGTGKAGYDGDGANALKAELNQPFGVTIDPRGDLYFCDTNNHVIRRILRDSKFVETIVGTGEKGYSGDGGPADRAQLNEPYEIRFHPNGDLKTCALADRKQGGLAPLYHQTALNVVTAQHCAAWDVSNHLGPNHVLE